MNRGLLLLIGTVVAVPVLLWMVRHEEPKRDSKPEPKPEAPKAPVAEVVAPVVSQPAVPAEPVVPEPAKPEVPTASSSASESVASEEPVVGESAPEPSAPEFTPAESPAVKAETTSHVTGVIINDDGTSQELSVNSATENKVFLKKADGPFPEWVTTGARLQLKLDVPGKKKNQLVVQAEISQLGDAELTCDLAAMNAGLKKRYMNFLQALQEPSDKA